jgi:hypothetical protein
MGFLPFFRAKKKKPTARERMVDAARSGMIGGAQHSSSDDGGFMNGMMLGMFMNSTPPEHRDHRADDAPAVDHSPPSHSCHTPSAPSHSCSTPSSCSSPSSCSGGSSCGGGSSGGGD